MLGTNDLHNRIDLSAYDSALDRITRELLDFGVVPILSNIPHRTDRQSAASRVGDYNAVVREVAARNQVPLLNYWRALRGPEMARAGMEPDGIHPNAHAYGASFTERGQRYGYNQRNLTALQTLDKIKRIVYEDGPPE
jgi:lysophospholipase L1-like esterase